MIRFRVDTTINRPTLRRHALRLGIVWAVCGLLYAGLQVARHHAPIITPAVQRMPLREQRCRERFLREHPGEEPLNVAIGRAAVRFHKAKPMGKFVLGLGWDDKGNDCSDFVKCCVDEGVGAKARFKRGSPDHVVGDSLRYQYDFEWDRRQALLPGDIVAVKHSPWYDPYPGACWHVGIIGSDGMVYDFTKLKRWPEARYGRTKLEWFTRHAAGPGEVMVRRLLPEYRYRLRPIGEGFRQDGHDDGDG